MPVCLIQTGTVSAVNSSNCRTKVSNGTVLDVNTNVNNSGLIELNGSGEQLFWLNGTNSGTIAGTGDMHIVYDYSTANGGTIDTTGTVLVSNDYGTATFVSVLPTTVRRIKFSRGIAAGSAEITVAEKLEIFSSVAIYAPILSHGDIFIDASGHVLLNNRLENFGHASCFAPHTRFSSRESDQSFWCRT